ncbi:MAG: hypothetical protein VX440_02450 [Pseudomonadota bacterium]|nr:hypothetical protein [Pseudomonadota bacterium]
MDNKEIISSALEKTAVISDDPETCCIRVSGDDASKFLQGQFSNDINELDNQLYQISSFSTHQGKVIALLKLLKAQNGYFLLINKSISEYFINKLSMYVLNSKVTIEILNDIKIFCILDNTGEVLKKLKLSKKNQVIQLDKTGTIILNNTTEYYKSAIVIQSTDNAIKNLIESMDIKESAINTLKLLDIFNCYIRINNINKEKYIPQVLNLEKLNGINYKKGCYTGQEIVARTHYLGKIKKRVFIVFSKKDKINIEDKVYNKDGESVGEIIDDGITVKNFCYSLAVLKIDEIDNDLFIKDGSLNIIY